MGVNVETMRKDMPAVEAARIKLAECLRLAESGELGEAEVLRQEALAELRMLKAKWTGSLE